jgi:hypothetical protein
MASLEELLKRPLTSKLSYRNGYRYCANCLKFYYTGDDRCPVCGNVLRNRPRHHRDISERQRVNPEAHGVRVD